jgi:hypothetical protein
VASEWANVEALESQVDGALPESLQEFETEAEIVSPAGNREKVSSPGSFGDDLDLPEFFR